MKDFIYTLCLVGGDPFYCGRTNDMKRRLGEHRSASKTGTETVYQVIRQIEQGGDKWEMVLLTEVDATSKHYEKFWVYTLICEGYELANMKQGDAQQAAERDAMHSMRGRKERYSDAQAFLDALQREQEEAAARAATARLNARLRQEQDKELTGDVDPDRMLFANLFETEAKFFSPGLRELQKKRAAKK
jgi:predicted GIY-YIG superfamily endonuclease